MNVFYRYRSPLGGITLASDGECLTGLWFDGQRRFAAALGEPRTERVLSVFERTAEWLDLYFGGCEPDFTPPLRVAAEGFRREVLELLLAIPYGKTTTYGRIAAILAQKRGLENMSARAVGNAVGHNPVLLIIPCHRVIGADGSLTGYAGGTDRKERLLRLENAERSGSYVPRFAGGSDSRQR